MKRRAARPHAFTLVELLIVIGMIALLVSVLLASLSRARKSAIQAKIRSEELALESQETTTRPATDHAEPAGQQKPPRVELPRAAISAFSARVDLTPRLSVGTAQPESIYEAKFTGKFKATAPVPAASGQSPSCEIHLPLPPQIISLADLSVTVDGVTSDAVSVRDASLVWAGNLPETSTPIEVTYSAVGRGLYAMQTPQGKILDTFDLQLIANGSDVRMLELSLQPTNMNRSSSQTSYSWNYKRLMFGRPIALDVLGIAPIDRLGELRWLGPMSVVAFGLIVGLYAHAFNLVRFNRWVLLMVLGAFTGAYPLMYFAQEFVTLPVAIAISGGLAFVLILVRTWSAVGLGHALRGVVVPAAATMSIAMIAVTRPQLQGILLTASGILLFTVLMLLIPKIHLIPPTQPAAKMAV